MPESYWAAISAIIVMLPDVTRTWKASAQRLVGTAIGVMVGGTFAALFGQQLWAFGAAVTITVLVCGLLGFGKPLACRGWQSPSSCWSAIRGIRGLRRFTAFSKFPLES